MELGATLSTWRPAVYLGCWQMVRDFVGILGEEGAVARLAWGASGIGDLLEFGREA